jgi:hypothetical protein
MPPFLEEDEKTIGVSTGITVCNLIYQLGNAGALTYFLKLLIQFLLEGS